LKWDITEFNCSKSSFTAIEHRHNQTTSNPQPITLTKCHSSTANPSEEEEQAGQSQQIDMEFIVLYFDFTSVG
jgi:hypothetical protein